MRIRLVSLWFLIGLVALPSLAWALQVTIDSASARAVLAAVQNPKLTSVEAQRIAELKGNQGLVAKAVSYHLPATTATLAEALLDAAHGTPATSDVTRHFRLEELKPRAQELAALLARIDKDPIRFRDWVAGRVAQFSPKSLSIDITGYLIAGGTSGGFSFEEPVFFLNMGYFAEFDAAKVVMAHELYHAVQNALADHTPAWWVQPDAAKGSSAVLAGQCATTAQLFTDLYQEGSASYVGDPLLLSGQEGPMARKARDELQAGLSNLRRSSTLLELAVTGLDAPRPVPYDDVYAVGFYVPEILYKLGYAMARAIATDESSAALSAFLQQPGFHFAAHYLELPKYGQDGDHPKLGPNTIAAINRLSSGCRVDGQHQ